VASVSGLAGAIVIAYGVAEAGTLIVIPGKKFASMIAARSVQTPPAVAQMPFPGFASGASSVLFTWSGDGTAAAGRARAAARARVGRRVRIREFLPMENSSDAAAGGHRTP